MYDKYWELGLEYFETVISLDPDHKKAKAMTLKIKQFQQQQKLGKSLVLISIFPNVWLLMDYVFE